MCSNTVKYTLLRLAEHRTTLELLRHLRSHDGLHTNFSSLEKSRRSDCAVLHSLAKALGHRLERSVVTPCVGVHCTAQVHLSLGGALLRVTNLQRVTKRISCASRDSRGYAVHFVKFQTLQKP